MSHKPPYSRWRYWASYIKDQTLEATEGEHTDYLAVILRHGKLLLQANSAIYSWEDNYYNFRTAFEQLDWDKLNGDETLLLGLGLGSVPQMIEELFGYRLHYTALEYDGVIAELAQEYLLNRLESPIDTIVADAEVFMAQNERKFDFVLVDLFVDDAVPTQFNSIAFLESLRDSMEPGACLITNRLAYTETDREASEAYYSEVFMKVFPDGALIDVESNLMLFSEKRFLFEQ